MLRVLAESQGTAIAISDEALLAGTKRLGATEGIFPAPEAGALVAAAEELKSSGWIQPEERVVLFNTGTGLKYSECF
jgi:threonine synthase